MKYEKSNHDRDSDSGDNQSTAAGKAAAAAPAVRRFCAGYAQGERGAGNIQRPQAVRPAVSAANDFLKTVFLPKMKAVETTTVPSAKRNTAKTERDFYKSLSLLKRYYGITVMSTRDFNYPYNVALSLWDAERQLKGRVRHWDRLRLLQDGDKTFLVGEERYSTGSSLYYIPVIPLYRMLKERRRRQAALLLLSVCSYLYRNAGVPYYRQENCYLYWMYEMMKDWITDDEENEDRQDCLRDLRAAEQIGKYMERKIARPHNVQRFEQRINSFKGKDVFEQDCLTLACETLDLYKSYPDETVFSNVNDAEEDLAEEEEMITIDKYISFCADSRGTLQENLSETVNNDFQAYAGVEEPLIVRRFDGSGTEETVNSNFAFEDRLFPLLEQLIFLLNNY